MSTVRLDWDFLLVLLICIGSLLVRGRRLILPFSEMITPTILYHRAGKVHINGPIER